MNNPLIYIDPSGESILSSFGLFGYILDYFYYAHKFRDEESGEWAWDPNNWNWNEVNFMFYFSTNSDMTDWSAAAGGNVLLGTNSNGDLGVGYSSPNGVNMYYPDSYDPNIAVINTDRGINAARGVYGGKWYLYSITNPIIEPYSLEESYDLLACLDCGFSPINYGLKYNDGIPPLNWNSYTNDERIKLIADYVHKVNLSTADYWVLTDIFYNMPGGITPCGTYNFLGNNIPIKFDWDYTGHRIRRGFSQYYRFDNWIQIEMPKLHGINDRGRYLTGQPVFAVYLYMKAEGWNRFWDYLAGR